MSDLKPGERQKMISFRIDEEGLAALERLEAAVAVDVIHKRRRSVAIRRAILEATERLGLVAGEKGAAAKALLPRR